MFGPKDKGAPKPSESTILGNFNLQATLPNGRSINIAGYVFDGESLESLNDRLDNFQSAIDRQRARCEVETLETTREQRIQAMHDYLAALGDFEAKQKKGFTLSSQEKMMLQNKATNLRKMQDDIRKGEEAIEEAKVKGGLVKKRAGAGA